MTSSFLGKNSDHSVMIRYAHHDSNPEFSVKRKRRSNSLRSLLRLFLFTDDWNEAVGRVEWGIYSSWTIFYLYCTIPHARVKARAHVYTYVGKIKLPLAHNNLAHPGKKNNSLPHPITEGGMTWETAVYPRQGNLNRGGDQIKRESNHEIELREIAFRDLKWSASIRDMQGYVC